MADNFYTMSDNFDVFLTMAKVCDILMHNFDKITDIFDAATKNFDKIDPTDNLKFNLIQEVTQCSRLI